MANCEGCGNDEGAYSWCLDCLTPDALEVAQATAAVLGGTAEDWAAVAEAVVKYLGGEA